MYLTEVVLIFSALVSTPMDLTCPDTRVPMLSFPMCWVLYQNGTLSHSFFT